jgi:hypothetical protein
MAKLTLTSSRFRPPMTALSKCILLVIAISAGWSLFTQLNMGAWFGSQDASNFFASDDGAQSVFSIVLFIGMVAFVVPLTTYRTMVEGATKKLKFVPSYGRHLTEISRHELTVPALRPNAWRGLNESLDCMIVKVPDRRRAVWTLEKVNEESRSLSASLLYTPDALGRKAAEIYPRRMHVNARVEGFGVSSKLFLTYTIDSPMDFRSVKELVERTNENIVSHMMAAEVDQTRPSEMEASSDSSNPLTLIETEASSSPALDYRYSDQVSSY